MRKSQGGNGEDADEAIMQENFDLKLLAEERQQLLDNRDLLLVKVRV